MQRGGRMEHLGEVFLKTDIKDTWTKPRRRVEGRKGGGFGSGGAELLGENADKCNWITIK